MMKRMMFLAAALVGCNSGTPTSALLADTNRDGVIDDTDRPGKAAWSPSGGAIFLANVDDDDSKGANDASDEVVNGPEDLKDLARINLMPWKAAPATAKGTLTIEGQNADGAVRVFRNDSDTWSVVDGNFSARDLVSGLHLGIEAKDFVQNTDATSWDGYVVLHLIVTDGAKTVVDDSVKLRVAPFIMISNTSALADVWNAAPGDKAGDQFHAGMMTLAGMVNVMLDDATPPSSQGIDQWAEDWWQIGVTYMPGPNGTTQMMRVTQRSAQPDREAGAFAAEQLGPDVGFIWPHTLGKPNGQSDGKGYSLDSFGNHDTLPPYTNGADSYPLGRIINGGNTKHHIDPVVKAFYEAQAAQGPPLLVDTTWLVVGHIDEIMSYVPANTPRGWKLLYASPALAKTMLTTLNTNGNGSAVLFPGKFWLNQQGSQLNVKADITVSALLADTEIMAASDAAAANIAPVLAAIKAAAGLSDDEIIEMPTLFERADYGAGFEYVAHTPGTVNLRALNGAVGIPKPWGPQVGGVDIFEKDLQDRLGTAVNHLGTDGNGLKVVFVEDWDDYHALDGEVHCASTTSINSMPNVKWWEAGR